MKHNWRATYRAVGASRSSCCGTCGGDADLDVCQLLCHCTDSAGRSERIGYDVLIFVIHLSTTPYLGMLLDRNSCNL